MEKLPAPILEAKRFWAIQISDSEYRKWSNADSFSKLVFNWGELNVSPSSSYRDISIVVAKRYSKEDNKKIKNMAYIIYLYSRLRKGDGILGIDGKSLVKKTGVITSINYPSKLYFKVEIKVKWLTEIKEENTETNIFNTTLEIQKVSAKMLKQLKLSVTFSFDKNEEYSSAESIGKEISFLNIDRNLEYDEIPEKEDKGGNIFLFYGTNRNKTGSKNPNKFFGDELSELKLGKCVVSIPKGHTQGEIERPFSFWKIETLEKDQKHVILNSIVEQNENEFISHLTKNLGEVSEKAALIFVHGYNNTFADAARRTAQIAWDIPFNGVSGFFSWSSCGRTLAYPKDIETADASIPSFEKFIEIILQQTNVEKLHFIAHSMGNRLLTATLNRLALKPKFEAQLKIIQQIVLAAPDIDQAVFKNTILPQFRNIGLRRTLYASEKDKALQYSEQIRGGLPRLGDAGNSLFVENGIDTVDASNVKSIGLKHSYIFETKELISDLHYLLNHDFPPLDRRLRARKKEELTYWLFPK